MVAYGCTAPKSVIYKEAELPIHRIVSLEIVAPHVVKKVQRWISRHGVRRTRAIFMQLLHVTTAESLVGTSFFSFPKDTDRLNDKINENKHTCQPVSIQMTETFPLDEALARTCAPTSRARCARPIALTHSKHNTHVTHSVTQHDKQEASSELMYIYKQKMCVNSDWAIKVCSCEAGCSSLWLSWTYVAQSRAAGS